MVIKEKGNGLLHLLDKYIGIPIVYILGLIRKKKSFPKHLENIAILNLGSIGDNVLMSSSVEDIRRKYPNTCIDVYTGSTNYAIVQLINGINKIQKISINNPLRTIIELRNVKKYDILIDFGPWPRLNSIYSFFFNANYKIGFNSENQYRHFIYDKAIIHSRTIHEIENYRNLISPLVKKSESLPKIIVNTSEKVNNFIKDNEPFCLIHAWPGGLNSEMKEWNKNYWVQLISAIKTEYKNFFLTGAPSDNSKSEELIQLIHSEGILNVINLSGKLTLSETVYIISKSKFVFSVNTGIAHIAAALNKSQICLHGPTNVNRWRPYSENTLSVTPSKGKYGYLHFGSEYNLADGNCMDNISVSDVLNAYKTFYIN